LRHDHLQLSPGGTCVSRREGHHPAVDRLDRLELSSVLLDVPVAGKDEEALPAYNRDPFCVLGPRAADSTRGRTRR
jgi:hypothetical protein